MTLNEQILMLFPGARIPQDYVVFQTGGATTQEIGFWNVETLGARPSQATLDAARASVESLIAYANSKQWAVATGGHVVTINGKRIPFDTSPDSMTLMNGNLMRLSQANPPTTVNWQVGPASFQSIAAADFAVAATSIADWVQTTFDLLPSVFASIAGGTITTTAQIDAAFAS